MVRDIRPVCNIGAYKLRYAFTKDIEEVMGCRFNDQVKEYDSSSSAAPSDHLAVHCNKCAWWALFERISVLGRFRDRSARHLQEASCIQCFGLT